MLKSAITILPSLSTRSLQSVPYIAKRIVAARISRKPRRLISSFAGLRMKRIPMTSTPIANR